MQLRNGTNTISDVRFAAARDRMYERQSDEYETVHNGSGRSEELPSQLSERHRREERALETDFRTMSVAQWLKRYPDTERTSFLAAHEKIDDEIIKGLHQKADQRALAAFLSAEISAGKALREQQPQHQEQTQKVRQQQM